VVVSSTPDGNYDLVFYEFVVGAVPDTYILLDDIIIGISKNPDGSYYEVFNWGDNKPDENSNVDYTNPKLGTDPACASGRECDNREIPTSVLYGTPPYQSGILIDVDYNTDGKPPEGSYRYLVILAPSSLDSSQVDAIVVAEVSGGKFGVTSVQTSMEGESQATEEAVAPAEVEDPNQSPDPPSGEGTTSESDPSTEEESDEQNQPPEPEEQDQSLEPPAEQPPAPP
jgi:hypothetical protein